MMDKYLIEIRKIATYTESCRDWHEQMMKEAQKKDNEYYGHLGAFMALTGLMIEFEEIFKKVED